LYRVNPNFLPPPLSARRADRSVLVAADGIWTHDLVLTKDALYQLSYSSDRQQCLWLAFLRPAGPVIPSFPYYNRDRESQTSSQEGKYTTIFQAMQTQK
jgi:hypothetical protein